MPSTVRQMTLPDLPARVQAELDWSLEHSVWLNQNLSETFDLTDDPVRDRLTMAFMNIALDHREGLIALVALNARSSVMALARSILDATVRGLWVRRVPDKALIERFLAGHSVGMPGMLSRLKKLGFQGTDGLQRVFSMLSDFAHGEARQVQRWIANDAIEPRHRDSEMVEMLCMADQLGMVAALERESLAGGGRVPLFEKKTAEVVSRFRRVHEELLKESDPDNFESTVPKSG